MVRHHRERPEIEVNKPQSHEVLTSNLSLENDIKEDKNFGSRDHSEMQTSGKRICLKNSFLSFLGNADEL